MINRPLLLCYDGSEDAKNAIREAASMFGPRHALVLAVWQDAAALPALAWAGASIPDLDEVFAAARDGAGRIAEEGVEVAAAAGLDATPILGVAGAAVAIYLASGPRDRRARRPGGSHWHLPSLARTGAEALAPVRAVGSDEAAAVREALENLIDRRVWLAVQAEYGRLQATPGVIHAGERADRRRRVRTDRARGRRRAGRDGRGEHLRDRRSSGCAPCLASVRGGGQRAAERWPASAAGRLAPGPG